MDPHRTKVNSTCRTAAAAAAAAAAANVMMW
jgi:hypothetical protein